MNIEPGQRWKIANGQWCVVAGTDGEQSILAIEGVVEVVGARRAFLRTPKGELIVAYTADLKAHWTLRAAPSKRVRRRVSA